jgi:hypothetical protein
MLQSFETKIVGVTFDGRQSVCARLFSGARLLLVREPENLYDPNAIGVLFQGQKCGYIAQSIAKDLAQLMDSGKEMEAVVRGLQGGGELSVGVDISIQEREESQPQINSPENVFTKAKESQMRKFIELTPFIDHLEFMGYTVTEPKVDDNQRVYICNHPIKMDFFLIPLEQLEMITFRIVWTLDADAVAFQEFKLLKSINGLNSSMLIASCYLTSDNQLIIRADWLKEYDRISFGIFIECFLDTSNKLQTAITQAEESTTVTINSEQIPECADHNFGENDDYSTPEEFYEDDYDDYSTSEPLHENDYDEYFDETDCSSCPHASGDSLESCEQCERRSMHPSGNWDDIAGE